MSSYPWRTGRSVGRTLYDADDRLIGLMDTPELAAVVVAAVNQTACCCPDCYDCPIHGEVGMTGSGPGTRACYELARWPGPQGDTPKAKVALAHTAVQNKTTRTTVPGANRLPGTSHLETPATALTVPGLGRTR